MAGPRSRRYGGRPINTHKEPAHGSGTKPRPRCNDPGWVAVNTETIVHRVDSREIEHNLPHVWQYAERVFRSG